MPDITDNRGMNRDEHGLNEVTMRTLNRETAAVIEEAVRSGKSVLVTLHGAPKAVLVPLTGSLADVPGTLFGVARTPSEVRQSIRMAEADLIGGKVLTSLGFESDAANREAYVPIPHAVPVSEDVYLVTETGDIPEAHSHLSDVFASIRDYSASAGSLGKAIGQEGAAFTPQFVRVAKVRQVAEIQRIGHLFHIEKDIPGIRKEDVKVTVDERQVIIDGIAPADSGRKPIHEVYDLPAAIDLAAPPSIQVLDGVLKLDLKRRSDSVPIMIEGTGKITSLE
jgi:prevent-host-death family protein